MAKKAKSTKKKTTKKVVVPKISVKDKKRGKINKYIFWIAWIAWAVVLLPMYLPNKCAAFFDFWLHASFTCPPVSLIISLILGALFLAFITWIVGWIITWFIFKNK